jgi:hypothetical protein
MIIQIQNSFQLKCFNNMMIIQFHSIQFIYVQNLTAQRPITKLARARKWEE